MLDNMLMVLHITQKPINQNAHKTHAFWITTTIPVLSHEL